MTVSFGFMSSAFGREEIFRLELDGGRIAFITTSSWSIIGAASLLDEVGIVDGDGVGAGVMGLGVHAEVAGGVIGTERDENEGGGGAVGLNGGMFIGTGGAIFMVGAGGMGVFAEIGAGGIGGAPGRLMSPNAIGAGSLLKDPGGA